MKSSSRGKGAEELVLRGSWEGRVAITAIRAYQQIVSPWLRPACRYEPSCSQYAIDAIGEYGMLRGVWLGSRRLLRCHPLGGSGYDPVP
jgi:putative membrane protein insertion efficiency factor